jgi:hypothetical protein
MLVSCKGGCKGKKGTTNAVLDVETNTAVCDFCDEEIPLSSFIKNSMKQRGEILRKDKRKSFQFKCDTCQCTVETIIRDDKLTGIDCSKDCQFNVSEYTLYAMKDVIKRVDSGVEDE